MNKDKKEEKKEGEENQVEVERVIDPGYFYPNDHIESVLEDSTITNKLLSYHEYFGFDSSKRYNIHLLDAHTLIYIAGAAYYIYDIITKNRTIFFSKDGAGIGSIAVHPSKEFFAVAEKGTFPNIYVYQYPSLKLKRILRKGTERSYSNITFSKAGTRIASVGSAPDFQLCVWDWMQETILLKAKAFSQEVYRVTFSDYNEGILTTSGIGHIKFWKIAETFTGLKLKGEIGKFGQIELSDVTAYYEFPDGKVLSGTEYGRLLLWEGNMIKAVLSINETTNCHERAIEVILLEGEYIVTAGDDGLIKFWDFNQIDNAEGDDRLNFYIMPTREYLIKSNKQKNASILSIVRHGGFWILYDANGYMWKIKLPNFDQELIFETNAGKNVDLAVSGNGHATITLGEDGALRLWDYVAKREVFNRTFNGKGTCLEWVPENPSNRGRIVYAGYHNGIMRVVLIRNNGFTLVKTLKVHKTAITFIKVSPNGKIVCVIGKGGSIFLLEIDEENVQNIEPFCLIELGLQVNDVKWHDSSKKLLFACDDGYIREIEVPQKSECDISHTYLRDITEFRMRTFKIKMMEFQKPKMDELDDFLLSRKKDLKELKEKLDVEWDPASIIAVSYIDKEGKKFICMADGKYLGYYYICEFGIDRPVQAVPAPPIHPKCFSAVNEYSTLVAGLDNGTVLIKRKENWDVHMIKSVHDRDTGKVRKACFNFDNTVFLTCAEDGTFNAYQVDLDGIKAAARGEETKFLFQDLGTGIRPEFYEGNIEFHENVEEDINDDNVYCIQEAKLLTEEDNKKSLADKKKQKVLEQIKRLRFEFEQVKLKNKTIDENARLNQEDLEIDPEYTQMLNDRVTDLLEETKKELEWDKVFWKKKTDKLKRYFVDELEVDRFTLKALKTKHAVTTFKAKKKSSFLQQNLAEIYQLIDEEAQAAALHEGAGNQSSTSTLKINKEGTIALDKSEVMNSPGGKRQTMAKTTVLQPIKTERFDEAGGLTGDLKKQDPNATAGHGTTGKIGGYEKYDREKVKQAEAERLAEYQKLQETEPSPNSFDPEHVILINEAIEKLGDYKLKSSKDYIVPEHLRMNVGKKKKHMFLLEEFVYNTKMKFNNEVLNLRQMKINILDKIEKYNKRIQEINKELGVEEKLFTTKLDEELETPEKYYEIDENQIDEYTKQKEIEKAAKSGMFGNMGGGAAATDPSKADQKSDAKGLFQQPTKDEKKDLGLRERKGKKVQHSELEQEIKVEQEIRLKSEKKTLLDELNSEIDHFDKEIVRYQGIKNILESDMKIAEMKLITHYQELLILNDMEERDNQLISKLFECRKEKTTHQIQLKDIETQKADKKKEERNIDAELADVTSKYNGGFPDDTAKANKLYNYYKKQYAKKKKKEAARKRDKEDNDGGDGDDASEDSIMDSDEDDDDDDDDEKVDISPIESDQTLKDLLERRLTLDDRKITLAEEIKDLDKQLNIVNNKLNNIEKDLKKTEGELRDYQREKLQKVNKLHVSHFLKLSQIQNLIRTKTANSQDQFYMPEDLSSCILFTDSELERLHKRIGLLDDEKRKVNKQHEDLKRKKNRLMKENAKLEKEKIEKDKAYEEKHMLKFGDVIDLSILDSLVPTKEVMDLREQFKKEEKDSEKLIEDAKQRFLQAKKRLLEEKKENTKILDKITKLGTTQMKLNKNLDSTNKQIFKEENEDKKDYLVKQKGHLIELVKFLSKEIEDLKTEISLFKRKGGHIYTMVTTNKKNGAEA